MSYQAAVTIDHLRYLRKQPYRRRVHARLRHLIAEGRGKVAGMDVLHVAGDRCCRREPWPVTYIRLLQSLADDGERVVGLVPMKSPSLAR